MSLEKYVRWHGLSQFLSFPARGWQNLQECIHPQPNCLQSFLWIKLYGFFFFFGGGEFWYHFWEVGWRAEDTTLDVKYLLMQWKNHFLSEVTSTVSPEGCDGWERFKSSKGDGPWAGVPRAWNVEIWVTNQSTTLSDCWLNTFGLGCLGILWYSRRAQSPIAV